MERKESTHGSKSIIAKEHKRGYDFKRVQLHFLKHVQTGERNTTITHARKHERIEQNSMTHLSLTNALDKHKWKIKENKEQCCKFSFPSFPRVTSIPLL